jgi:hypothetical protein
LAFTQSATPYKVNFTTEKIKIDGILDESVWQHTPNVGSFWQYFPSDTIKAVYQTDVKITYDSKYIYLSAKCYARNNKYVVLSYRRDYRAGANDNVSFVFDTFNDRTNAFLFGTNPLGVMREALLYNGATDNTFFSEFWDNKWVAESKIYDNYWTTEIAIPFTTLRFKEATTQWLFKAYRFDTQINEQSTVAQIPQNQLIMNLGYSGAH